VPLGSVPDDHTPEQSGPQLDTKVIRRCPPTKLVSSSSSSSTTPSSDTPSSSDTSSSLYPLLTTSGDAELKLAPLHIHHRRSLSPASSSAVPSRSPTSSPEPASEPMHTVLPSIRSITATEHLAHQVGKLDMEREQDMESASEDGARSASKMDWEDDEDDEYGLKRREHAKLIKDLLLLINTQYRKKYGTPKPGMLDDSRSVTPVLRSTSNIVSDIAAKVSPATRMLMGPGVPGIQISPSSADVEMTAA
jgi:hypothetical protein